MISRLLLEDVLAAAMSTGADFAEVYAEKTRNNGIRFLDGKNVVSLTYGSSDFAKGLTYVQVKASVEDSDLACKLTVFAIKKTEVFNGEWSDNEHFKLLVGGGKRKQCCDVDFSGDEINMYYYVEKTDDDFDVIECEVADDNEIETIEVNEALDEPVEE